MTPQQRAHWQHSHQTLDLPIMPNHLTQPRPQHNHNQYPAYRENERPLKPPHDEGCFLKKVCDFRFLGRGAPGHVVADHVGEEGGGYVEGEASEED